jgi:hypothetical protein
LDPESSHVRQNILTMALYNPESKPLNLLCELIHECDLDEISLYDMVHKPQEFKRLMEENTEEVKDFLKDCYKQTDVTREISELDVPDYVDSICFTVPTTELNTDEIKTRLKEEIRKPKGFLGFVVDMILSLTKKDTDLGDKLRDYLDIWYKRRKESGKSIKSKRIKLQILEIEWLEGNLTKFLKEAVSDYTTENNELAKTFLQQLRPFWYLLFTGVFLPFMTYFGLVTYYFCFILSNAYEPRSGFF